MNTVQLSHLFKVPANISILELIQKSRPHYEMFRKCIEDAQVPQGLTPEGLTEAISQVTSSPNVLFFTDEDITKDAKL